MNYGAYGSYPRRRTFRKRVYAGSGLVAYARRRRRGTNPNNQYTFKKSRVGRFTMTNYQKSICSSYGFIILPAGSTQYTAEFNGLPNVPYINLFQILAGSPEFVTRQTQYSYYMITGMAMSFTRRWMDPIAFGTNGVNPGFLQSDYTVGLSTLYCNFYPNLVNSIVGQPVQDADSSWEVSPFITTKQTHYQPFPKNFTTGTNSNGLGVWNACNQANNIQGELAFYNLLAAEPSDVQAIQIWDFTINLYISFCNNTGS